MIPVRDASSTHPLHKIPACIYHESLKEIDWDERKKELDEIVAFGKKNNHSGYDSRFEKEYIISVHEGEVVKVVTIDFKEKSLIVNLETAMSSEQ